ncbi:18777_t:CDS:2 [Funneliformis geosporum]|uniref:18777_t:CDS:1 n=1 Tax=Funneliformis geosporum TaxID=1117311 RepID=A0A9W4X0B6_9GLOM|nr:18777_t:CDS:2 [Funneliformis geosporum]
MLSSLPNLHIFRHLPKVAVNFGTLVNTTVSSKEAVHRLYGGLDTRYNEVNNLFINVACDAKLCKLLNSWYIETPLLQADTEDSKIESNT